MAFGAPGTVAPTDSKSSPAFTCARYSERRHLLLPDADRLREACSRPVAASSVPSTTQLFDPSASSSSGRRAGRSRTEGLPVREAGDRPGAEAFQSSAGASAVVGAARDRRCSGRLAGVRLPLQPRSGRASSGCSARRRHRDGMSSAIASCADRPRRCRAAAGGLEACSSCSEIPRQHLHPHVDVGCHPTGSGSNPQDA